tara:strand:+ start:277 stop:492 length:216 start_codon:yes stop_codon:yes gene_type:complete
LETGNNAVAAKAPAQRLSSQWIKKAWPNSMFLVVCITSVNTKAEETVVPSPMHKPLIIIGRMLLLPDAQNM